MSEEEKREIKDILGKLFIKYRGDIDVLKLSQWVDRNIILGRNFNE